MCRSVFCRNRVGDLRVLILVMALRKDVAGKCLTYRENRKSSATNRGRRNAEESHYQLYGRHVFPAKNAENIYLEHGCDWRDDRELTARSLGKGRERATSWPRVDRVPAVSWQQADARRAGESSETTESRPREGREATVKKQGESSEKAECRQRESREKAARKRRESREAVEGKRLQGKREADMQFSRVRAGDFQENVYIRWGSAFPPKRGKHENNW